MFNMQEPTHSQMISFIIFVIYLHCKCCHVHILRVLQKKGFLKKHFRRKLHIKNSMLVNTYI